MARDLGVKVTEKGNFYFISYNSEDQDRVSEYVKELDSLGVPMWYDKGLHVGNKWENEISERIATCDAVIMFITKDIFKKEKSYVHKEYIMATEFFEKKIYLVYLDEIAKKEIPVRYISWWIDLQSFQGILAFNCDCAKDCANKTLSALGLKPIAKKEPKVETPKKVSQGFDFDLDDFTKKTVQDFGFGSSNVKKTSSTTKTTAKKTTPKTETATKTLAKNTINYKDGSSYQGDITDGKPNGYGKHLSPSGVCYEGNFANGKKHGKGVETFGFGTFTGEWVDGVRKGKGEYLWKNGACYLGDIVDGKPNGQGKLTLPLGVSYDGSWVNGKKQGYGIYHWANGDRYEGEWADDTRTGYGELFYADGSIYKGEFKNGARHGEGKFISPEGKTSKGTWKDGLKI